jgi:signal transduction histidine kinase/HAMP domain-containing protein
MNRTGSIRKKLILTNLMAIIAAFIIVATIVILNFNKLSSTFSTMNKERSITVSNNLKNESILNTQKIQGFFEKSLYNKGQVLLKRDRLVLKPLFLDNSFNGVRNLLTNLYSLDEEILSLSFFTVEGEDEVKAWAYLNREFREGLGLKTIYNTKTKSWSSSYKKQKITFYDENIIEIINNPRQEVKLIDYQLKKENGQFKTVKAYQCTVPIFEGEPQEFKAFKADGEPIAFLRYILTLEKMQDAVATEKENLASNLEKQEQANLLAANNANNAAKESLAKSMSNLTLGALFVLIISFIFATIIGNKVSQPILQLKASAQIISQGDYSQRIDLDSNDEIGELAENFNEMRLKIEQFTKNLQGLVDQKTKEISDILNSIQQGIFTVNKDLTINTQHSAKAEEIYNISEFHNSNLQSLFSISNQTHIDFQNWFKLINNPKKLKRWKKYEELKPIAELTQLHNGTERIIQIDYQPIIENGELSKLMVLSTDVTQERKVMANLESAQHEQKLIMQRVIALINNDQDTLQDFFNHFDITIKALEIKEISKLNPEELNTLFRNFHTIKGNAGSLGFSEISRVSSLAEDILAQVKNKETPVNHTNYNNISQMLKREIHEIDLLKEKIFFDSKDSMIINKTQFNELQNSIQKGEISDIDDISQKLIELNLSPFRSMCSKYSNIITEYRKTYNKNVSDLVLTTPNELIHRDILKKLDTAIVHLIRNALDHGIETNEERRDLTKAKGLISMGISVQDKFIQLSVEDNGKGMNAEQLSLRAVSKGILNEASRVLLSEEEKIELIFSPGFSSKDEVSDISGRGFGMDIVKESIEAHGGTVAIETKWTLGTTVTLRLPL